MNKASPSSSLPGSTLRRQPWHKSPAARLVLWLLVGSVANLFVVPYLFIPWFSLGLGKTIAQRILALGGSSYLAAVARLWSLHVPDWVVALAIGRWVHRWPVKSAIACSLGLSFACDVVYRSTASPLFLFLVPRFITIALLVMPAVFVSRLIARRTPDPRTHCTTCGYNLTDNVSGICPECGKPVPPSAPRPTAEA